MALARRGRCQAVPFSAIQVEALRTQPVYGLSLPGNLGSHAAHGQTEGKLGAVEAPGPSPGDVAQQTGDDHCAGAAALPPVCPSATPPAVSSAAATSPRPVFADVLPRAQLPSWPTSRECEPASSGELVHHDLVAARLPVSHRRAERQADALHSQNDA